jgi:hypothetical protein
MRLRWPFRCRAETRASGSGYTARITAARADYISGTSGAAELTAAGRLASALDRGAA